MKYINTIARGAGIIFFGTIITYLLRFFLKVIISRYFGPANYGLFSLGEMILNFALIFSLLGFQNGIIKYVAHYAALGDKSRIKGAFFTAFKSSLMVSIFISFILIIFSKILANSIFKISELRFIIVVFAIALPFNAILMIITNTIIAFKKPEYNLISNSLGRDLSNLVIVLVIILIGGTILHVSFAYLFSVIIAFLISYYILNIKFSKIFNFKINSIYNYKQMLFYSMPLFFSGIFVNIMSWTDTFFLGFLRDSYDVGIYNVAMPLAASLALISSAFSNIFFPMMTEFRALNKFSQLRHTYVVILRWILMISLPFVLIIILFPKIILQLFFGSEFISGSLVLIIIILAYFFKGLTGPCTQMLMAFDKIKMIFYVNSISAILNILFNIILIPIYGLIGAAIATAVSIVIRQLILFILANKLINLKLNILNYYKILIASLVALMPLIVLSLFGKSLIIFFVSVLIFVLIYLVGLILFKAFNNDDYLLMLTVEKKLGLNLSFIKRWIFKFL